MKPSVPTPAYASLRAVVRPAIVAHELLLRQQDQTAMLIDEAKQLLAATEELLQKVGLAQAYAGSRVQHATARGEETRAELIARSYAAAGMAWSELAATTMALASKLIEAGNGAEAQRLARSLEELGEPTLGADLQRRIDDAAEREAEAKRIAAERETEAKRIAAEKAEAAVREKLRDTIAIVGRSNALGETEICMVIPEIIAVLDEGFHESDTVRDLSYSLLGSTNSLLKSRFASHHNPIWWDEQPPHNELKRLRKRLRGRPEEAAVRMGLARALNLVDTYNGNELKG